jgi:hypothetical protein
MRNAILELVHQATQAIRSLDAGRWPSSLQIIRLVSRSKAPLRFGCGLRMTILQTLAEDAFSDYIAWTNMCYRCSPSAPYSILRRHPNAIVYLDINSAWVLRK